MIYSKKDWTNYQHFILTIIAIYFINKILLYYLSENLPLKSYNRNKPPLSHLLQSGGRETAQLFVTLILSLLVFIFTSLSTQKINIIFYFAITIGGLYTYFQDSDNKLNFAFNKKWKDFTGFEKSILTFIFSIFACIILYQIYLAHQLGNKYSVFYIIYITVFLLIVYGIIALRKSGDGYHLHHYFVSWLMSMFIVFNDKKNIMQNIQGLLLGIMIGAINMYGTPFIINHNN